MAEIKILGTLQVPGDKSISHRSLMFSALSEGRAKVSNILQSADVKATASVLRSLGVSISEIGEGLGTTSSSGVKDVVVDGVGLRGLKPATDILNCDNSGTTCRLMAGILAATSFESVLTGDESLIARPMLRVAQPLSQMGARFSYSGREGYLPMKISGALSGGNSLRSIKWDSKTASAQVKSAILLAGLVGGVPVTVTEPTKSRDHTERYLRALGVPIEVDGTTVSLTPVERLQSQDVSVPADPSSAAFFAALAAMLPASELHLPNVCLNPTRTGFFAVLEEMGAVVEYSDHKEVAGEQVGCITVRANKLKSVVITESQVPSMVDEIPMLACMAALAEGETVITGASELRVKETDRIAAVVGNLRSLGVDATELPDGMRVIGNRKPLSGSVKTFGDHRIAMAFAVLGVASRGSIVVDDPGCVAVSYPSFWEHLKTVVKS